MPFMAAIAVVLFSTACGSGVKITKPSIDAQIIIDRSGVVETEAELRDLERLANEYELAYRRHIGGAAAERFKALTADVLTDAARNMQEYQQQQENDRGLCESMDRKLDRLEEAWRLELTTPDEDRRKMADITAEAAEIERRLEELDAERNRITEALDAVGYDDDDADELLERYGNRLDDLDRRYAETESALAETISRVNIYRLAYKLQRGESFMPVTAEESCEAELCDENCM